MCSNYWKAWSVQLCVRTAACAGVLWQRSELQDEDEEDKITALQHAGHTLAPEHSLTWAGSA